MDLLFIQNLQKQLVSVPLPGLEAQLLMAPPMRRDMMSGGLERPENPRRAAVLCLFFWENSGWNLALIERAGHDGDRHSGQIGFPGGKVEPTDASLAAAALREAEEEVGVTSESVELLGPLTEIFIPVSGFLVHPFVGFTKNRPVWRPQESEVAAVVEVTVAHLKNGENKRVKDLAAGPGRLIKDVPFFDIAGHVVWGATAMILSELLSLVEGGGRQASVEN